MWLFKGSVVPSWRNLGLLEPPHTLPLRRAPRHRNTCSHILCFWHCAMCQSITNRCGPCPRAALSPVRETELEISSTMWLLLKWRGAQRVMGAWAGCVCVCVFNPGRGWAEGQRRFLGFIKLFWDTERWNNMSEQQGLDGVKPSLLPWMGSCLHNTMCQILWQSLRIQLQTKHWPASVNSQCAK